MVASIIGGFLSIPSQKLIIWNPNHLLASTLPNLARLHIINAPWITLEFRIRERNCLISAPIICPPPTQVPGDCFLEPKLIFSKPYWTGVFDPLNRDSLVCRSGSNNILKAVQTRDSRTVRPSGSIMEIGSGRPHLFNLLFQPATPFQFLEGTAETPLFSIPLFDGLSSPLRRPTTTEVAEQGGVEAGR